MDAQLQQSARRDVPTLVRDWLAAGRAGTACCNLAMSCNVTGDDALRIMRIATLVTSSGRLALAATDRLEGISAHEAAALVGSLASVHLELIVQVIVLAEQAGASMAFSRDAMPPQKLLEVIDAVGRVLLMGREHQDAGEPARPSWPRGHACHLVGSMTSPTKACRLPAVESHMRGVCVCVTPCLCTSEPDRPCRLVARWLQASNGWMRCKCTRWHGIRCS